MEAQKKRLVSVSSALVKAIRRFKPATEYRDENWRFFLKVGRRWMLLAATCYDGRFWLATDRFHSYVFDPKKRQVDEVRDIAGLLRVLPGVVEALQRAHAAVRQDTIAYHKNLSQRLPPTLRKGLLHRTFVRKLIPDWLRYDKELGKAATRAMIALLEAHGLEDRVERMTAGKFFEYCRIAYLANKEHSTRGLDLAASGRELYLRWADGRDEGLRDVDLDSEQAFSEWFDDRRRGGGHPWEILRGGNTTHIDLYVERYLDQWRVCLSAFSSTRLAETCRIALAFKREGMPFKLAHDRSYLQRLQCDDLVGVVPEYDSVHRGWQGFPEEFGVADCVQLSWFKDRNDRWLRPPRQLAALVDWLPERPLVAQQSG